MDTNKLILESFNKALELNGQNIKITDNLKNIKAMTKAIVKAERVQNQDGTYFISVNDIYKITTLEKTEIGDLISFKNKQYKVESVDNTTPLYISYCKYNGIDIVYNIALAESSTTINKDNTYQITATAHENGVSVENPTIIYTSSNDAIATVNASGLVTGISEGECTISCNYKGVSATLTVNVDIGATIELKPIKIVGDEYVKIGTSKIYTILNQDGTEPVGRSFNFTLEYGEVFEIIETTANTITLKALVDDDMDNLIVTDKADINIKASMYVNGSR